MPTISPQKSLRIVPFNKITLAITGSSGFIGSSMKAGFLREGHRVHCFQRSEPVQAEPGARYIKYHLDEPLSDEDFKNVDYLIHCAFVPYSIRCKEADEINIKGTRQIIEICRRHDIKIIFLSSFSAHENARSHYGQNKMYLESMFDLNRDLILRLGLVVGSSGMFSKMKYQLDNRFFIPLIDNGQQLMQTIGISDLLAIVKVAVSQGITGRYNISEDRARSMKEIFKIIRKRNIRNLFIPVSSDLILPILDLAERIGIFLPFSSDSVLGLKYSRVYSTKQDLLAFGLTARPLEELIDNIKQDHVSI